MNTFRFKTNIQCENCLNAVTPYLNNEPAVENWDVSLKDPDKILEASGSSLSPDMVVNALKKAGYEGKQV